MYSKNKNKQQCSQYISHHLHLHPQNDTFSSFFSEPPPPQKQSLSTTHKSTTTTIQQRQSLNHRSRPCQSSRHNHPPLPTAFPSSSKLPTPSVAASVPTPSTVFSLIVGSKSSSQLTHKPKSFSITNLSALSHLNLHLSESFVFEVLKYGHCNGADLLCCLEFFDWDAHASVYKIYIRIQKLEFSTFLPQIFSVVFQTLDHLKKRTRNVLSATLSVLRQKTNGPSQSQKMVDGRRSCLWLYLIVYGLILLKTEGFNIGITDSYVETAVAKGAVKGFGAGINNWLVHIIEKIVDGMRSLWLNVLVYGLILLKTEGFNVGITYVETAVAKGAVCLDGSPPAYHLDKGFGAGINNWLVHIEGGGWCNNVADCLSRSNNRLGSSKHMDKEVAFSGMLSNEQKFNPDFYNWNRIKVRYCDGASFTGDVEAVNPETNLHFRGARVFLAIIEDLLAKGMKNAQNAILSGCSAGGLASILHCDKFQTLIPIGAKVKCLSDAGYFIHIKDVSGGKYIEAFYNEVVALHGSSKNLPESCTSRLNPALCFFPQYVTQQIQTPLFIINAAYDSWQINNILVPGVADPHGTWHSCKLDINNCSSSQLQIIQSFRLQFLNAVSELGSSTSRGLFVDSCYSHCQTEMQETWLSADSPMLGNTTIAKAVGDWYYDRSAFQKIDCPYPCNPTCHNNIFHIDSFPKTIKLKQAT